MKYFMSNTLLMVLLIALLLMPLGGFYFFSYENLTDSGHEISNYIPVKIMNSGKVEVLAEHDSRNTSSIESSEEAEISAEANSERYEEDVNVIQDAQEEFDPSIYSPATRP